MLPGTDAGGAASATAPAPAPLAAGGTPSKSTSGAAASPDGSAIDSILDNLGASVDEHRRVTTAVEAVPLPPILPPTGDAKPGTDAKPSQPAGRVTSAGAVQDHLSARSAHRGSKRKPEQQPETAHENTSPSKIAVAPGPKAEEPPARPRHRSGKGKGGATPGSGTSVATAPARPEPPLEDLPPQFLAQVDFDPVSAALNYSARNAVGVALGALGADPRNKVLVVEAAYPDAALTANRVAVVQQRLLELGFHGEAVLLPAPGSVGPHTLILAAAPTTRGGRTIQ
ncbi:hypothetical protein [Azospirillum sp. B4]|uniref:hypothetical protein n=1 Tax=Azospirillum sp. B4 TaxID=95605 RepID=UPI0011DD64E2|nr:hypothetical protein [Azospirillum sp. B4]